MCVITGASVYLHCKIIYSNQFFNSNGTEDQKAVRVGRLVEILLQEQEKPTFLVFIAGGIDAAFNILLGMVVLISIRALGYLLYYRSLITIPSQFCQYFSHAILYAMHDNNICKEILRILEAERESN